MDAKQLAVYEEFARNIPGFLPSNDLSQPTGFLAQPMKVNEVKHRHVSTAAGLLKVPAPGEDKEVLAERFTGLNESSIFWSGLQQSTTVPVPSVEQEPLQWKHT